MQVSDLFSMLIVHAKQDGQSSSQTSGLENEYQIMLRKYTRSTELQHCRIGVVGTVALVERMAASAAEEQSASQQDALEMASELIHNAVHACKTMGRPHAAIVFTLLCDELAHTIGKVCHTPPLLHTCNMGSCSRDCAKQALLLALAEDTPSIGRKDSDSFTCSLTAGCVACLAGAPAASVH